MKKKKKKTSNYRALNTYQQILAAFTSQGTCAWMRRQAGTRMVSTFHAGRDIVYFKVYLHDDVINRDMDQFHKKANKSHYSKSYCCCHGNLMDSFLSDLVHLLTSQIDSVTNCQLDSTNCITWSMMLPADTSGARDTCLSRFFLTNTY